MTILFLKLLNSWLKIVGSLKMIFRYTIINKQNPLLLLAAILNKNPMLAQRHQNIEIYSLSIGWRANVWANVGPTVAKSASYSTNSQHWPNVSKLCRPSNLQPTSFRQRNAVWSSTRDNTEELFKNNPGC